MAKAKKTKSATDINSILKKDLKFDSESYMKNIVMADDYSVIPVSPMIDFSCGGGIREGGMVLISGPPKVGKTCFCLQLSKNLLGIEDGIKRNVYYFDVENRIHPRDLDGIQGLDYNDERFNVYGSTEGDIAYAENIFSAIEKLASSVSNSLIILDSLSMLLTKSEAEYQLDEGKGFRANVPRLTAIFCRKMAQKLRPGKNILVGILHTHANQAPSGPMAKRKLEGGGSKIQYLTNYKFTMTHKQDWTIQDSKIGHEVFFKCDCSPLEGVVSKGSFYHRFGVGIDRTQEIVRLAKDLGILKCAGSWFTLPNEDETKVQGEAKVVDFLNDNPEQLTAMQDQVYEFISMDSGSDEDGDQDNE